jgi:hypothetical protein
MPLLPEWRHPGPLDHLVLESRAGELWCFFSGIAEGWPVPKLRRAAMSTPADVAGAAPDRNLRRRSLIGAATLLATCMVLTSACSSSGKGKGSTTTTNAPPASSTAASSASASAPSSEDSSSAATSEPAEDKIAGTWNGTFTGKTSSGTFKVAFTQQGETVAGNITITGTGGNGQGTISGKLTGNKITFGAIVGTAVSFTGSFSGNSMSGSYTSGTDSGTWKATR